MSVLGCFLACVRLHHDGAFIASLLAAVASASARRNPFSSHAALNVDGPANASTESGEHFVACHMTGSSAANGRRAISFHDHHVFMASARNCVSASAGAIGAGTTVRRCDGDERDFFTGMLAAFFTRTLADFLATIRAKIVESGPLSAINNDQLLRCLREALQHSSREQPPLPSANAIALRSDLGDSCARICQALTHLA